MPPGLCAATTPCVCVYSLTVRVCTPVDTTHDRVYTVYRLGVHVLILNLVQIETEVPGTRSRPLLHYGCYNSKLRSMLLNDSTKKYCSTDLSNRVEIYQDARPPNLQNATRKFQKKVAQVCKITNFDRHGALFYGASMGAIT